MNTDVSLSLTYCGTDRNGPDEFHVLFQGTKYCLWHNAYAHTYACAHANQLRLLWNNNSSSSLLQDNSTLRQLKERTPTKNDEEIVLAAGVTRP